MNAELEADQGRPTLSGDLPTVLAAAPMFRRAPMGYDRFQVDTYVRWAEDELVAAEREREHLQERQHRTSAALDEARELLSHSPAGADFLRLSRRMGTVLAAASDEAEAMLADAQAEAGRLTTEGRRALAHAADRAGRIVAGAVHRAEEIKAEAGRIVAEAERARQEARAQVAAQRRRARWIERRAVRDAEQVRQQGLEEAAAARLQARQDVVQVLSTGRDERRRADAAAAATRERLDAEAASRRAELLAEVGRLEQQRAALHAELERTARPVAAASGSLRGLARERIRAHLRRHATL
jgi:hypothetical protein